MPRLLRRNSCSVIRLQELLITRRKQLEQASALLDARVVQIRVEHNQRERQHIRRVRRLRGNALSLKGCDAINHREDSWVLLVVSARQHEVRIVQHTCCSLVREALHDTIDLRGFARQAELGQIATQRLDKLHRARMKQKTCVDNASAPIAKRS